eukprot:UC1_evm1s254
MGLAVAVYNVDVSAWEPLLEPVLEDATSGCNLWSIDAEVVLHPGVSDVEAADTDSLDSIIATEVDSEARQPPGMLCSLSSRDPLNLTVTTNALESLLQSAFVAGVKEESIAKAAASSSIMTAVGSLSGDAAQHDGSAIERTFHAFELENATGHGLSIVLGPTMESAAESFETTVPANESCPLPFVQLMTQRSRMRALTLNEQSSARCFSFQLEGCHPVQGIPVDCTGNRAYRLKPLDPRRPSMWIVVEVSLRRAVKVVTVRSGLKITNGMKRPLEIGFAPPVAAAAAAATAASASDNTDAAGQSLPEPVSLCVLLPGDSYSVPIVVAYRGFLVRPAGLAYDWSKATITFRRGDMQIASCAPLQVGAPAADNVAVLSDASDLGPPFRMQARVTREHFMGVA